MKALSDPSLVLYLPFHEMDGEKSISQEAHGHMGTNYGTTWTPQGRVFNGSGDYISFGNILDFDYDEPKTVIAWIFPQKVTDSISNYIVSKQSMSPPYGVWGFRIWDGKLTYDYINDVSTNRLNVRSKNNININVWSMVSFRKSDNQAANFRFFVNGDSEAFDIISDSSASTATTATSLQVGVRDANTNTLFKGTIGDLLVFRRALTSEEIQTFYFETLYRYR